MLAGPRRAFRPCTPQQRQFADLVRIHDVDTVRSIDNDSGFLGGQEDLFRVTDDDDLAISLFQMA